MTPQSPSTRTFRGLNNVTDPQRLDLGWQTRVDNVDITDKGALRRCHGYARATTNTAISGAYATKDMLRLYVVDNGALKQMSTDLSTSVTLRTGLNAAPMSFEEVNGQVFFTNGVDYGVALDGSTKAWGVSAPAAPTVVATNGGSLAPGVYQFVCTAVDPTGLESSNSTVTAVDVVQSGRISITGITPGSNLYATVADGTVFFLLKEGTTDSFTLDALAMHGRELPFWNTDTPRGSLPTLFQGQMYTAEAFPQYDATVIWRSLPLQFHHFDPGAQGIAVPGTVRMLESLDEALIIGTDRAIVAYDGDVVKPLAAYGVVSGWHASEYKKQLYFWSLRGLCRAMPFSNITETTVSVPPGLSAGAMVVEKDGMRRYVVALQKGGESFNRRIT